jgi:hypothetical protein
MKILNTKGTSTFIKYAKVIPKLPAWIYAILTTPFLASNTKKMRILRIFFVGLTFLIKYLTQQ